MHILPNKYFFDKEILRLEIEDESEKNKGILSRQIIARHYYEMVESVFNEEDEIISEIIFEDAIVDICGTIPSAYIEGLENMIKKVDNGYKFTVLNDEEYEDLKLIVEKLKGYLAEHSK